MRAEYMTKIVVKAVLIAAAVAAIHLVPVAALAWNFTVPAQEIKPVNGVFVLPASVFEDGKARHFEYSQSPTQRVRFFVVKSVDGVIRAAFDACEVCWKAQKGYKQDGTNMICINCGLKFRTDKINEVHGGCNPSALPRTVKDGKVIITQQDVLKGLRFFQ